MAKNKTINEKIAEVLKRIEKEPNKVNDTINQTNAFLSKINNSTDCDDGLVQKLKESFHQYLDYEGLNAKQKDDLLEILKKLRKSTEVMTVNTKESNVNKPTNVATVKSLPKQGIDNQQKHNNNNNNSIQNSHLLKNLETRLNEIIVSIKNINNNNIESKINLLKEDIKFEISKQMKESLKDTNETIEMLPVKLDDISKEISSIEISSSSSKILDIPTDEQAIVELAKFMQDGLKQFENISRYYVQNQSKIEKSDKNSTKAKEILGKEKSESFEKGKNEERTRLAKKIYADFPANFEEIQTVFDDLIDEKYKKGEKITITIDNRKEYELSIEGIVGEGEIEIDNFALLIDGEIVRLATIKKGK